jgi:succinyl-diaminopimelate desuccinylase
LKIAGPSNIGNFLAAKGIPATAGFGVRYRGLHAADESVELASIPQVAATYALAVSRLLDGSPNSVAAPF